jgi:hypothetical protein
MFGEFWRDINISSNSHSTSSSFRTGLPLDRNESAEDCAFRVETHVEGVSIMGREIVKRQTIAVHLLSSELCKDLRKAAVVTVMQVMART